MNMKRFYVEAYSKSKFIINADYDSIEDCTHLLDECITRLIIKDTKTEKEYILKEKKK
jgi:hypothetical protein